MSEVANTDFSTTAPKTADTNANAMHASDAAPNDATTSDAATAANVKTAQTRRTAQRRLLLLVVPAIAAVVVAILYLRGGRVVETDNAYVKAEKVPISAEVSGVVSDVLVGENATVSAGQVLFRLDSAPFVVAVDKAEAKLAQVRTDLAAIKASYREKQAEINLAKTRYRFALKDQQRQADLIAQKFIPASRFDDAKQTADLAAQEILVQEKDLTRIGQSLGGSVDTPVELHPAYRTAMAELAQAKLDLARIEIKAATAGTVSKPPKRGQYLSAGATAMALVIDSNLWIEANFTETDLTHVRPGQTVSVHIDTYPDTEWSGVVDSLSPATGAEFSLIPAQNATGNWVKISQRVPVRIALKSAANQPVLRAGLSAVVAVDTGYRRHLLGMTL